MTLTTAIVLFAWFVVLCGAVVAIQTAIRKAVHHFKPSLEGNRIYKGINALFSLALGIPIAFLGNFGIPWVLALIDKEIIKIPWPFIVVLGLVVGMSSAFIWARVKVWIKGKLNIKTDASTESTPPAE